MRKFYLELDGTRIDLNGASGIWFFEPEGLGVTFNNKYADTNSGFFKKTQNMQKQGSVTGTMLFMATGSNPYSLYETFVNSVLTASQLVLVYNPCGTEYKAQVSVNYISKSEAIVNAALKTSFSFSLEGLWYTEQTLTGTGSVSVTAGGQVGTCVIVRTSTALTNPSLKILEGQTTIARVDLSYTTTGTFEYSNFYNDSHILDGTTDIVTYVDTSYPIYGRTRSAFTVELTDAVMTVIVRKYWRTV